MPVDVMDNFCTISKSKLSDFTIIGEGGFGNVYKARHADWGIVAVKSLKAEHVAERHKKNLQAEAQKLSRLNHQNIVQLYGVVLEAGNYSVVLEYVEHGNLDDFINTYKVPWSIKTKMIYSIVLGINYLHTQTPAMIHRDLKSQNLLVTAGFECKITDFGLSQWKSYSRQHTSANKSGTQGGTVTHIAPEVWEDCNYKSDAKCDVYAMGILLWEVLTEKVPFEGLMDAQISLSVCRKQRPDLSLVPADVPSKLVFLMEHCWQHDPSDRPTFAELKRVLDEEVSTEHFQEACERDTLKLMKDITDERAGSVEENHGRDIENICVETSNVRIASNHSGSPVNSHSSLPYPVQTQTSADMKKESRSSETAKTANSKAGVTKAVAHNGYIQLNAAPITPQRVTRVAQPKGPIATSNLPYRNMQTDAAPSDVQIQQETSFDAKVYLGKTSKASPKTHSHKSYRPMPPPGTSAFMPHFMNTSSSQPSMVIQDHGSGGKTIQLFNGMGTGASGMNIQVGNNNVMNISSNDARTHGKPFVDLAKITKSTNPIDEHNMKILAKNIGKPWMEFGRLLGFSEGELDALENDYRHHGHIETVYQMLLKWKKKMGKYNCKLVTVADKLVQMNMGHVAAMLDK